MLNTILTAFTRIKIKHDTNAELIKPRLDTVEERLVLLDQVPELLNWITMTENSIQEIRDALQRLDDTIDLILVIMRHFTQVHRGDKSTQNTTFCA